MTTATTTLEKIYQQLKVCSGLLNQYDITMENINCVLQIRIQKQETKIDDDDEYQYPSFNHRHAHRNSVTKTAFDIVCEKSFLQYETIFLYPVKIQKFTESKFGQPFSKYRYEKTLYFGQTINIEEISEFIVKTEQRLDDIGNDNFHVVPSNVEATYCPNCKCERCFKSAAAPPVHFW